MVGKKSGGASNLELRVVMGALFKKEDDGQDESLHNVQKFNRPQKGVEETKETDFQRKQEHGGSENGSSSDWME